MLAADLNHHATIVRATRDADGAVHGSMAVSTAISLFLSACSVQLCQAVEICDLWKAASRSRQGRNDRSYLALRAMARLRIGEFEVAQVDAEAALKQEIGGRLWTGRARELLEAARARDREYEYHGDEPRFHRKWLVEAR